MNKELEVKARIAQLKAKQKKVEELSLQETDPDRFDVLADEDDAIADELDDLLEFDFDEKPKSKIRDMFSIVGCNETTYNRLAAFCRSDGDMSQENLTLFGITVAYMQPNMIGEFGDPDFYWCRKFFKWFL